MSLAEQLQAQQKIMREKAEAKKKMLAEGGAIGGSARPAPTKEPTFAEQL